ncbi:TetR/AcrR family transcriptional regulator [Allorhizocola rhizosphaerae]|uniref:TetR/AcrR family transcriptional regulator n=1 Tax=Allorhizocola rhizosphaerae TaxID=1872709 RepID=UPI000E3DFA00|nr:TetR family transcriptional regulator [Allorhizocola rhizosphaerae]
MSELGRGEQTRKLIVDTAVRLFGELGYEKTTMRAIASAAGVSVGNAYYYFPSKESLVQEFYLQIQRAHLAAVEPILASGGGFADQLKAILHAAVDVWAPHHQFAGKAIGLAAVPGSPISPFSKESEPSREMALDVFRRLVAGTSQKMDPRLREELPEILWLGQIGLVVFWVHDSSRGQSRTRMVIDRAVPYLDDLIGLSRMKVLRPMTNRALELMRLLVTALVASSGTRTAGGSPSPR